MANSRHGAGVYSLYKEDATIDDDRGVNNRKAVMVVDGWGKMNRHAGTVVVPVFAPTGRFLRFYEDTFLAAGTIQSWRGQRTHPSHILKSGLVATTIMR
jgi:hypothetical protein